MAQTTPIQQPSLAAPPQVPDMRAQVDELTYALIALAFKWEREDLPGALIYRSATACADELRTVLATHRVPM